MVNLAPVTQGSFPQLIAGQHPFDHGSSTNQWKLERILVPLKLAFLHPLRRSVQSKYSQKLTLSSMSTTEHSLRNAV